LSSLAEQYRRKADDAAASSSTAENYFMQRMQTKIATHWRDLAERVERQAASGADPVSSIKPSAEAPAPQRELEMV
jgi:hypothetical protein